MEDGQHYSSLQGRPTVNYRPVALTSVRGKVIEHIVYNHTVRHSDRHRHLADSQQRFKKGSTTKPNLFFQSKTSHRYSCKHWRASRLHSCWLLRCLWQCPTPQTTGETIIMASGVTSMIGFELHHWPLTACCPVFQNVIILKWRYLVL